MEQLPNLPLSIIFSELDAPSLHALYGLCTSLRRAATEHVRALHVELASDLEHIAGQGRAKFKALHRVPERATLPLTISRARGRSNVTHAPRMADEGLDDEALDLFLEVSLSTSALFTVISPLRLLGLDLGGSRHLALRKWISAANLTSLELHQCTFFGPLFRYLKRLRSLQHVIITLPAPELSSSPAPEPHLGGGPDAADNLVEEHEGSADKTGLVKADLRMLKQLQTLQINDPHTRPTLDLMYAIGALTRLTSLSLNMAGPFTGSGDVHWWFKGGDISPILQRCGQLKILQISSLARDGLEAVLQKSTSLERVTTGTCQSTVNLRDCVHRLHSLQIKDVLLGSRCRESGEMLAHMPLTDLREPLQIGTLRVRVPNTEDVEYLQASAQLARIRVEASALASHYNARRAGHVLRVTPTMLSHYPVCLVSGPYSVEALGSALAPLGPFVDVLALNEMHDDVGRGAAVVQALGSNARFVGLRWLQLCSLGGELAVLCPAMRELYVFGVWGLPQASQAEQQQEQQDVENGAAAGAAAATGGGGAGTSASSAVVATPAAPHLSAAGASTSGKAGGATAGPVTSEISAAADVGGPSGSCAGVMDTTAGVTCVTEAASHSLPPRDPMTKMVSHALPLLLTSPCSHSLTPELFTPPPPSASTSPTASPDGTGGHAAAGATTAEAQAEASSQQTSTSSSSSSSNPTTLTLPTTLTSPAAPAADTAAGPPPHMPQSAPAPASHFPVPFPVPQTPTAAAGGPMAPQAGAVPRAQQHLHTVCTGARLLAQICADLPHLERLLVHMAPQSSSAAVCAARAVLRDAMDALGLRHITLVFM